LKIQGKYLLAGVLLIFSVGLAFDSLSNYINPYLSVTQVMNNMETYKGKSIQVIGIVESGTFIRGDGGTISFSITDGLESMKIRYSGAIPQNLDEGKDVVAIGSVSEDTLEAEKILVKCPSKYEGENPPKPNNHIFLTAIAIAIVAFAYLAITIFWKKG
jgi:cytochrome c-type biogenesis protein CcmE